MGCGNNQRQVHPCRFGGRIKLSMKVKQQKINHLVAYDIASITHDLAYDDVSYLTSILCGDGWTQYNNMTDEELDAEYRECVGCWGSDYEKSRDSCTALRWRDRLEQCNNES